MAEALVYLASGADVATIILALAMLDARKRLGRIEGHLWPDVFRP